MEGETSSAHNEKPNDKTESPTTSNTNALPPKRPKKKKSELWDHFSMMGDCDPNNPRATCNYCGKDYGCCGKRDGTSNLWNHLYNQCPMSPYKVVDKKQKTLCFLKKEEGQSALKAVGFSEKIARNALAKMIIVDELPFRHVEKEGFKFFVEVLEPRFTIPCRTTVARDCMNLYYEEKKKLKKAFQKQRVCLTTDTRTSIQNLNYMCLTAHWIDNDWNLHKRILNFFVVPNHKGVTIGKHIEKCLQEWGIDRIFTITLDNASSNDTVIQYLKRKTKDWKTTILDNEFLHMRCCAHIVNLIVCEGLKDQNKSVVKIRNAVRYVRSSPSRL